MSEMRMTSPLTEDWEEAACIGHNPEWFFISESGLAGKRFERLAKDICAECVIMDRCLEWALEHDERGIWGGTTEKERRVIRRLRSTQSRRSNPMDYTD